MRGSRIKVIVILLLTAGLFTAGAVVYYQRHRIFEVSAESFIRKNLPAYITVKDVQFDLQKRALELKGIAVKNPSGYTSKFLAEISSVRCEYKTRGETIFDGIEVTGIRAGVPEINIERTRGGELNVNNMGKVMGGGKFRGQPGRKENAGPVPPGEEKRAVGAGAVSGSIARKVTGFISLPDEIYITGGRIVFTDEFRFRYPYRLTIDDINGKLVIKLSEDYRKIFFVKSRGTGFINGDGLQRVDWDISLDPTAKDLTMKGEYKLRNVDITQFLPYYDAYSPVAVEKGRCSGALVFNFSNGDIDSINTLYLKGLRFRVKGGGFGGEYWSSTLPEIIKYLEASPGEIIFDFGVEGRMTDPRFYPGPHVKRAIRNMVVDKISEVVDTLSSKEGENAEGQKSDVEKVTDIVKSFLKR